MAKKKLTGNPTITLSIPLAVDSDTALALLSKDAAETPVVVFYVDSDTQDVIDHRLGVLGDIAAEVTDPGKKKAGERGAK